MRRRQQFRYRAWPVAQLGPVRARAWVPAAHLTGLRELPADDEPARALRAARMGVIEARFPDPLPVDDRVAREWGRLQAAVSTRGGQPRKRLADLAIAATANVHGVPLLTNNVKDLAIVADLVDVQTP